MTFDEIDAEVCQIMMYHGPDGHVDGHELLTEMVMRCIAKAVLTEREVCAAICDAHTVDDVLVGVGIAQSCAAMIRTRSNVEVTGAARLHRAASG